MTIQELLSAAQKLSISDQVRLASQIMQTAAQTLEGSSDAVMVQPTPTEDPLIGLFDGSLELADYAEEILIQEIQPTSGFTWKS